MEAAGRWIFVRRSWLPFVLFPVLLLPGVARHNLRLELGIGQPLMIGGAALRLVSVGYAGRITRTRSGALGPLVIAGPYRLMRNPLYVGNMLILTGGLLLMGRAVLAPLGLLLGALYYHSIVRWEERHLEKVFGEEYVAYQAQVPRWLPRLLPARGGSIHRLDLGEALYSERGAFRTLAGVSLVALLLGLIER